MLRHLMMPLNVADTTMKKRIIQQERNGANSSQYNKRETLKFTPTGFFTNIVNLKLTDYGPVHKISHIVDVDNFFRMDNSDKHV